MNASLVKTFNGKSIAATRKKKTKQIAPFSIRLTPEERTYLEHLAGNSPLSTYIRTKLLEKKAEKRRVLRKPKLQDSQYAALLAALGESRLSSNLNQLARHTNMGTLDVSEDTERELQDACKAVLEMRKALVLALGLQSESDL